MTSGESPSSFELILMLFGGAVEACIFQILYRLVVHPTKKYVNIVSTN